MKKIFKDKDKTISTENLYLLEYLEIIESEYIPGKSIWEGSRSYVEHPTKIFVLGTKKDKNTYIDPFTKTVYSSKYEGSELIGEKRVRVISPIISNEEKISIEEATKILETQNFYVINNKCKENTKKVLEFFERFNSLSGTNPEKAEEFAIDLINLYNENYKEEKSEDGKSIVITKRKK